MDRANGDDDVTLKILYCGVCHSDLHFIKNEWGISIFPMVPGYALIQTVMKQNSNSKLWFELFSPLSKAQRQKMLGYFFFKNALLNWIH